MNIRNFFKDKTGVMTVEFALLAPLLSLIMMGLIDAGEALMRYRIITQLTESVVHVAKNLSVAATQDKRATLSAENISIIKRGVDLITSKSLMTDVKVSVYVVSKSVNTSETSTDNFIIAGASYTKGDNSTEGAALKPGEIIIICESEYTQPVFFDVFKTPFNLSAKYAR
jgi:Flp pilus assembly protein TadG